MIAKIPLALLPGTLCTADLWADQAADLADITDITIFDTAQHDNLPDLAKAIHKQMPGRFAVAGLSYGGIVAFEVWRQNPDSITHLGLLNTTPRPVTAEKQKAQEEMVRIANQGGFQEVISKNSEALARTMELYPKIFSMAEQVGPVGFANQIKAQINRPDSCPILKNISCPTLVLCGEKDRLCPPQIHREMAVAIPNSQLSIIPDCGHLSTFDQPNQISTNLREWISR